MRIHNSGLQMYLRCGLQYEFSYVKKIERPQTFSLFRGTTLHKTRKKNLAQKVESLVDLPLEELREDALAQVTEAVQTEAFVPEPEVEKPADLIDAGVVTDYNAFQTETIPVLVEHESAVAPVGYDYELYGTLDLLDFRMYLRDLKTVGKTPQIADLLRSTQMTTYQLFAMAADYPIAKISHDYLIFRKKGVEAMPLEVEPRTKDDIRALLDIYQQAVMGISAGIFLPAPAGSWWCSPRYCNYWNICPAITKAAKNYFISKGEE